MLADSKMMLGPQRYYIAAVVLFVVWSTLYLNRSLRRPSELAASGKYQAYDISQRPTKMHLMCFRSNEQNFKLQDELRDAFTTIFKPIKVDPTQRYYRDSK